MQILLALVIMLACVAAVIYTHYCLAKHIAQPAQRWVVRVFLLAVGAGFAWVTHKSYPLTGSLEVLVLISAFCITHVPSACILFLKRKRHEQLR